jgi:hypothetical protein
MKKKSVEDDNSAVMLDEIRAELLASDDFILSYLKCLCILHGGAADLEAIGREHGWKINKLAALTSAITHFAARGKIKRGMHVGMINLC